MFLINTFCSYLIFLNFQAYFFLRNSTLASRNYSSRLKILAKNISLTENESSQQQPRTPNFECLAAKHVCLHPIRTCFFLTCTRLDATDGTCIYTVHPWYSNSFPFLSFYLLFLLSFTSSESLLFGECTGESTLP